MTQLVTQLGVTVSLWALLLSASCSTDFDSQMTLSGYRVVGISASPPEVTLSETVELEAHEFYDGNSDLEHEWKLCLHSLGAGEAYECEDPAYEFDIGDGPSVILDPGPMGLNLGPRLEELSSSYSDGTLQNLERGFEVWVKLSSGPSCAGCEKIDTVKRLTLREHKGEKPNVNPVIRSLDVIGASKRGQLVTLRIETDSPQRYVDPGSNKDRTEEYLYSWYSTKVEADPARSFGEEKETQFALPSESGPVEVVVTVRDGRGGLAVVRKTIDVK